LIRLATRLYDVSMAGSRAWLGFLVLGLAACTKPNPAVCCNSRVDCESIGANADQRKCASDLVCIDHACVQPQCTINTDCPMETPFCAPDQMCVQCLQSDQCSSATPVCDMTTSSCRGCKDDSECPSAVCDQGTGMCVDQSTIVYASTSGSTTADCTQQAPCEINRAFSVANVAQNTIKLMPGIYTASITVNDRTLNVHGPGATVMASGKAVFTVNDRAHISFFGLTIVESGTSSGNEVPLDCETVDQVNFPSASLDAVVLDSTGIAAFGRNCTLTVTRSTLNVRFAVTGGGTSVVLMTEQGSGSFDRTLFTNGDGIAAINGAIIRISNSVIADQTGADGAFTANGGAVSVSFSTIYNSLVKCLAGATACSGTSPNGVCIDNAIIDNASSGAPADTITGAACNVDYTLVTPQSTMRGTNNQFGVDPRFATPSMGDFHLQQGSPAIDAADPAAPPTKDFDGTNRPQGPRSDLGAFEFVP
jgi:hypothetical protein